MSDERSALDNLDTPLWQLIEAYTDGTATGDERAQLEQLLRTDKGARRHYLAYTRQQADLAWGVRGVEGESSVVSQQLSEEKGLLAVSSEPLASSDAHPTPRTKSWLDRASRHPKGPAIAIAVAVMLMLVGAMAVTPVKDWMAGGGKKDPKDERDTKESQFVAKLSNWHSDQWAEGTRPPRKDPRLKVGKRLVIESGLIEVTYLTGARVVIEGPAEYWVVGEKSGQLELGKLVARVSEETAKGFTVDTPSGRAEDLGTEFGVEVRENGAEEFIVLTGKVDVVREATDDVPEQRLSLIKDQVAFIAAEGRPIVRRNNVDARLVAAMRKRWDAVAAAAPQGQLAELDDAILRVDLQNGRGAGTPAVTQAGFVAFDDSHVTGSGNARATYNTAAGDVTVSLSGLDSLANGFFNRPRAAANDRRLAMAGLYRDFAFANGESPQSLTLAISGEGIAANTDYRVTFFSYDSDDTQGEHSVAYTGVSGTMGSAPPLRYTGGDHPRAGGQYAVTGTFTADGAGLLTVEMKDTFSAETQSHTGIRLNAFALMKAPSAPESGESESTAMAEELDDPRAKDDSEIRGPKSERNEEAKRQGNTEASEELAFGR